MAREAGEIPNEVRASPPTVTDFLLRFSFQLARTPPLCLSCLVCPQVRDRYPRSGGCHCLPRQLHQWLHCHGGRPAAQQHRHLALGLAADREGDRTPPDATACKEGGCQFGAVQVTMDAALEHSADGYVIYIKETVYKEMVRVPFEKTNLIFIGDRMGKTIITGSLNANTVGVSSYNTATVDESWTGRALLLWNQTELVEHCYSGAGLAEHYYSGTELSWPITTARELD
ncbi:hypothetical protein B296_00059187 [Ensete ventricosum]|uniref:Pectinesterase catalytic domain-containing protein n=1 Tax=Ensete ventricosum TaxID=4639 RepID=A0A426X4D4_ENSVE|nr:hypothetical protein B296_00059187 [Ensete ventricosum]